VLRFSGAGSTAPFAPLRELRKRSREAVNAARSAITKCYRRVQSALTTVFPVGSAWANHRIGIGHALLFLRPFPHLTIINVTRRVRPGRLVLKLLTLCV